MIRDISNALSAGILILALGWVYTTPNIYRALAPGVFGLVKIAPDVYSDAPARGAELVRMVRKSEENSERFFGKIGARPTYIVCTRPECDQLFDGLPFGLTMGFHRVLISSRGVEQSVFNHERIHVDLHALMGLGGFYQQRYPAWFDEGLSEFLAGPQRFGRQPTQEHKQAVLKAVSLAQWNALVSDGRYNRHYGAARALVDDIARTIGRAKLRDVVLNSQTRTEFMSALPASIVGP